MPQVPSKPVKGTLAITGREESDRLLNSDPTALLIGMLLDQQVPMEWAFTGPLTLSRRLGHLDPTRIAAMDVEEFVSVCCDKPAIHRFPAAMGRRIHALSEVIATGYGGDTESIWRGVPDGHELVARLRRLPGFGEEKTMIFVALLAKRFGVRPAGWEEAAGAFADEEPRTAADVDSPESLQAVRAWKAEKRRAGRSKQT